jgi:DegV family protein with EDD domain
VPVSIVTDSAADIDDDLAVSLGITVVPLSVRFGAEELVDRRDLTPEQFYERLAAASDLPETAAPAPGAFVNAFTSAFDAGADAVVCINISAGLSGTMQAATAGARTLVDRDIRVLDSRSVTWGLGSQVLAAARAAAGGADADAVEGIVRDLASRTHVLATLDTLENLKRGGRIGNAQALLGSLLSIKPIIDLSTGVTEEAGKVRTRSKALRELANRVAAAGRVENLAVMHGAAPDVGDLVDLLAEHHPREQIHVGIIGATVGVHGGPRVVGVTFQTVDG